MRKIKVSTIRKILVYSALVQLINAAVDLYLWFTIGFLVPSWTISALILGYSSVIVAMLSLRDSEVNSNVSFQNKAKSFKGE